MNIGGSSVTSSCYPSCLNRIPSNNRQFYGILPCVSTSIITPQDKALCGLISNTNINKYYSYWSCDINGKTISEPCGTNNYIWNGITCLNNIIVGLTISSYYTKGK